MSSVRILLSPALFALACGISAAEGTRVAEVRLHGTYTTSGGEVETSYADDEGNRLSYSTADMDYLYRAGLTFIGSLGDISGVGAPLIGVGLSSFQSRTNESRTVSGVWDTDADGIPDPVTGTDNTKVEITGTIFTAKVGWGWAMTPRLHLEALAHFGLGSLVASEQFPVYSTDTGELVAEEFRSNKNGNYREIGFEGGLYYTMVSGLQLGLAAGMLHGSGENTVSRTHGNDLDDDTEWFLENGGRYKEEFAISTGFIQASIGFRW